MNLNYKAKGLYDFSNEARHVPDRIYKFYSINENTISSIKDGYFWLAKPTDFNDPFDCYHKLISTEITKSEAIAFLKRQPTIVSRQARRLDLKRKLKNYKEIGHALNEVKRDSINKFGVSCFTKNYASNLMWSHYADKHKGLCLVFAPKESISSFLLINVTYTSTFTPFNYFDDEAHAVLRMLQTKSSEWEYEQEMRIFDNYSGRHNFPKSTLKEVIFGCKAEPASIQKISKLVTSSGYKDITFKQAYMQNNSFLLDFKEL